MNKYKFTVPEPFYFGECNSRIIERRFEDWLIQRENEEQKLLNQKFYPLPLPKNTKENRYEEMVLQEELRKRQRTMRAKQRLEDVNLRNSSKNGFKKKIMHWELEKKHQFVPRVFRAKEAPWFVKVNLFERMQSERNK